MFHYHSHNEIDKKRWNKTVEELHGLVYNYTWFLDAVCPQWSALINEDYTTLIPLPLKKKWGLSYVFPPVYAQQLGLSSGDFKRNIFEAFRAIPSSIKYVSLKISCNEKIDNFDFQQALYQNFILDLNQPYEKLFSAFSDNTKRNLKKAGKSNLSLNRNFPATDFIHFKENCLGDKYKKDMYVVLAQLISAATENNCSEIWSVNDEEGEIHAALFWIKTPLRSYYLSPTSSEAGKNSKAMFFLVNEMIKELAENDHILDFEGSNIENIARFFKGFNAEKSLYLSLTKNLLPWPINLIKP